jgi:signal transduction histidine kinase
MKGLGRVTSWSSSNAHAVRLDSLLRQLTDRTTEVLVSQDRLHRLLGAVVSLASDLSLPDVLRRVVESSCSLVGARYGALAVLGADRRLLEFTYVGVDEQVRVSTDQVPADLATDPRGFPASGSSNRSFLGVPVHVRGEVFGNLYLTDKDTGGEFTSVDEEIVVAVAAAAGIAIENARLYEQSRQREAWQRASNDVTSALLTGTGGRDALTQVGARARAAADGVVSAVVLPDDRGELVFEVVEGDLCLDAQGMTLPRSGSSWEVFATGTPKVLAGLPKVPSRSEEARGRLLEDFERIGPIVLVPMAAGRRVLGVLIIARGAEGRPFDAADVTLLGSFATQAALVLEFTRAQDDSQRLAVLEDRDRIARDLHDLVIQRLFGLGLGLQGLNGVVAQPVVATRLAGFVEEVDQTIREIRRTIFSLHEPPSSGISLRGQLLRAVQDSVSLLGFKPTIALDGPVDLVVPDQVRPDLLATLREALANIGRHASASVVGIEVSVDRAATLLRLVVRDNGKGLPQDGEMSHIGGLANMTARAVRWNGRCSIESQPGDGVTVTWSIPLAQNG